MAHEILVTGWRGRTAKASKGHCAMPYEQDEGRASPSLSARPGSKLKMPSDGEEWPAGSLSSRLTGKFLRCVAGADDPGFAV